MKTRSRTVVLLLVMGSVGCSRGASVTPTSPTATPSSPSASQNFYGYVADAAFHDIADARVEVVDGPLAGTSMATNAQGRFFYPTAMSSPITFRVSRDGYITATQIARSSGGASFYATFTLESASPPVVVSAGDYSLTITADSACAQALPIDARTRTFAATIAQASSASHLVLTIGGPNVARSSSVPGGVAGDQVAFLLYDGEAPGLIESLAPTTYLMYWGQASALVSASGLATVALAFDGTIDSCVVQSGVSDDCYYPTRSTHQVCTSKNSQFILTRR